ncbi:MAG: hypothetical protein AAF411_31660, partial [Myxococcota bacterium]
MTRYDGIAPALLRRFLGAYLLVHFAMLLPWCAELFSAAGMMEAAASPLRRAFPSLLFWIDTPAAAGALVGAG